MHDEFKGLIVLVVDDDEENCRVYERMLKGMLGCDVQSANTKRTAIDRLTNGPIPAVVLLDVCVPTEQDGYDACKYIKGLNIFPEVPVVMITARDLPKEV